MAEDLKLLIRKRGLIKGQVTLFKNYLAGVEDHIANLGDKLLEKEVIIELEARVEKANSLLFEFEEFQTEIELKSDESEFDKLLKEREKFQNEFYATVSRAKNILQDHEFGKDNESVHLSSSGGSTGSRRVSSSHELPSNTIKHQVKLPLINLPTFSGQYTKWLEFKDTFESLIHNNSDLGDIQKFHYLRAQLSGSAKQVVEAIEFGATNYSIAWEILCKRFDNKRVLIQNHISGIFEVSNLKNESAEGLRNLCDTVVKHLRALENLGRPVSEWDDLIIYNLASKLDRYSLKEWESFKVSKEIPTFEDFKDFIRGRADLLETLEQAKGKKRDFSSGSFQNKSRYEQKSYVAVNDNSKCVVCKEKHELSGCKRFLGFSVASRVGVIKRNKLCMCCFSGRHFSPMCQAAKCSKCGLGHHTLLHYIRDSESNNSNKGTPSTQEGEQQNTTVSNSTVTLSSRHGKGGTIPGQVLLSTAVIKVCDVHGQEQECRVLLDSASMSNFMSEDMLKRLGLTSEKVDISVLGIGQCKSSITQRCEVRVLSNIGDFKIKVACLVIPEISDRLPLYEINKDAFNIPQGIQLADLDFNNPDKVDMLIGAELFWQLIQEGQVSLGEGLPVLQNTRLGWIVSGKIQNSFASKRQKTVCHFTRDLDVQAQLSKFWEWEEPNGVKLDPMSSEEAKCEDLFVTTTTRDSQGRFVVNIPFKDSVDNLGDSKRLALNRLFSLERKFAKNDELRQQYCEYMADYEKSGYMTRVSEVRDNEVAFFLPHHGVLKESSTTTKLRVVYDGSARSDNGVSINDLQHVGPRIQEDLMSILLRFRQNKVAFCADIAKMYLQVWVKEDQRPLQRVLWRKDPSEEVQVFNLNTVVFGLTSSPFLAVRCLKQLALDFETNYPKATNIIKRDFYVDDLISGASSWEEAVEISREVSTILKSAGFELRKFCSNDESFLREMGDGNSFDEVLDLGEGERTKTLGLFWNYRQDTFTYKIGASSREDDLDSGVTKRKILSEIAQIFDPLGLLSASIIIPKVILQKLWLLKLSWDEVVPDDVKKEWLRFKSEILEFNSLFIPRFVSCERAARVEIHGFSDASQQAFGACVYVRTVDSENGIQSRLLCAKSRVAPIKALTIPKLELSAALLLSKLVKEVYESRGLNIDEIYLWCDSSVALSWIRSPAIHFNQFVSNRVSQIQSLTTCESWRYVKSEENPADLVSRGVFPSKLVDNKFWFEGPTWLLEAQSLPEGIVDVIELGNLPEKKKNVKCLVSTESVKFELFSRVSSLNKLKRVFAWCLRFLNNCREKEKRLKDLSVEELEESERMLVKIAQKECFSEELVRLEKKEKIKTGRLSSLNPFLDKDQVLRVGGRLTLSNFDYDKKYPIVLNSKHQLSELIVKNEHIKLMHAGPQLLLSSLKEKYWPVGGRDLVKRVIHKCIICARAKPASFEPMMGDLPKSRLTVQPAFNTTGVDYAGPFTLKSSRGRGTRTFKGYICLFVCFTTRAIHLEAVTSLSTDAFIGTFRRFVSRRGKPSQVYSDNGKNFQGAQSELERLGHFLNNNQEKIENLIGNEGVRWSFIPAYSPHFGGIWEAGVKTVKFHLKRVASNVILSFEDFETLLCQIEAIVNSRPLTPMSSDPADLDVITPAHFLIGRRLTSLPDADVTDITENRLSRFQRIQRIQQTFWARWGREYIAELQKRVKWKHTRNELQIGRFVIVREDGVPPMCWRMGRVVRLHAGADGICRVATVKTSTGEIKRAFSKLCPLPVE